MKKTIKSRVDTTNGSINTDLSSTERIDEGGDGERKTLRWADSPTLTHPHGCRDPWSESAPSWTPRLAPGSSSTSLVSVKGSSESSLRAGYLSP